jgi:hypothetical protein
MVGPKQDKCTIGRAPTKVPQGMEQVIYYYTSGPSARDTDLGSGNLLKVHGDKIHTAAA